MIHLIIADDHAVVRRGLRQIIEDTPGMKVMDEASTGCEVLEKIAHRKFDVAILDVTMPGGGVLDVIRRIKKIRPAMAILILSMHPEELYAVRVLKAGASGYLTKESAPEELVKAIRLVYQGKKYLSRTFAETLACSFRTEEETPRHEDLTDREYEVMLKLAAGQTSREIGEEMFISHKTVDTYRMRIRQKLCLRSSADIIHYVIHHKLLDY